MAANTALLIDLCARKLVSETLGTPPWIPSVDLLALDPLFFRSGEILEALIRGVEYHSHNRLTLREAHSDLFKPCEGFSLMLAVCPQGSPEGIVTEAPSEGCLARVVAAIDGVTCFIT